MKKGATTKGKGKKDAAEPSETHPCFYCHSEGAKLRCSQCKSAFYCGKACFKRAWKRHKPACVATVAAKARHATRRRVVTAARGGSAIDTGTCVICIGPVVEPVSLPCSHAYCRKCVTELRDKKVAQACPLCREELPPGLDGLFDLGYRMYMRINGMVVRGEVTWASLPPATQHEQDEAVAMMTEAADQGHLMAQVNLADIYASPHGVEMNKPKAFELYSKAGTARLVDGVEHPGRPGSQCNVAIMLRDGDGCDRDFEQSFHWFCKAAAQGHSVALCGVAECYESGRGVPQDYKKAFEYYSRCGISDDPPIDAGMALAKMSYCGEGIQQSYAQALALWTQVAEECDPPPRALRTCRMMAKAVTDAIQEICPLLGRRVVIIGAELGHNDIDGSSQRYYDVIGVRSRDYENDLEGHEAKVLAEYHENDELQSLSVETLDGRRGTAIDFGHRKRNPDPDYDGFPGTPRHWLASSGVYTVALDEWQHEGRHHDGTPYQVIIPEGRQIMVVAASVRAEGPGDGSGGGGTGRGKVKGKGKKGRGGRK